METVKFNNELAAKIGMKYEREMAYGVNFYTTNDENDYIRLIVRNGRGDELQDYFYEFSETAFNWLKRTGVKFEMNEYSRTWRVG